MKLTIRDTTQEGSATCYLCSVDLLDYINSIPSDFRDYEIQRGIIKNTYLDSIIETLKRKSHIPTITLIADKAHKLKSTSKFIETKEFRILDGLQRTYRLFVINECLKSLQEDDFRRAGFTVADYWKRNRDKLEEIGATRKIVSSIVDIDFSTNSEQKELFGNNKLWIEYWIGLDTDAQISKMLLLNAGQKSMSVKHQLELIFLRNRVAIEQLLPPGTRLISEKELSSIQYSKKRKKGEFHFSHLISALVSLSAGKVVNTNADFVGALQRNEISDIDPIEGFDVDLIEGFIKFLTNLDEQLEEKFGRTGVRWLGREVVLVGFFGAIGAYLQELEQSSDVSFLKLTDEIPRIVGSLDLKEFEECRNRLSLDKVNVGSMNKRAVYEATYDLLFQTEFAGWQDYFRLKKQ